VYFSTTTSIKTADHGNTRRDEGAAEEMGIDLSEIKDTDFKERPEPFQDQKSC